MHPCASASHLEDLEFVYQDRKYRVARSFVHPGGAEVLSAFEGQDISSVFRGHGSEHSHSLAAEELLKSFSSSPLCQAAEGTCTSPELPTAGSDASRELQQAFTAGQPLLGLVGRLGSNYNDWVHCPEAGQPRFFNSACAEAITKTPWWTVPLVWIPIITSLLLASACWLQHTACSMAYHAAAGVVLWQFIEYSIHRFIFHAIPSHPVGIVIHFLFHGCHHKFPMDKERLVFPPLPAASIAFLLYLMVRAATSQVASVPIFAGVLVGYLMYDMQHYAIHYGQHNFWLMQHARQNHLDHHFKSPSHGFGISSGFIDFLLSTCRPTAAQQQLNLASC